VLNILEHFLVSIVIATGLFVAVNLYLAVLDNVNPVAIGMTFRLRRLAAKSPSHVVFASQGQTITAVAYDYSTDQETTVYQGVLGFPIWWLTAWRGGQRSGIAVSRRAGWDLVLRITILVVLVLPSFALIAWLGSTVHWTWYLLLPVAISHQIAFGISRQVVYVKYAPFVGLALLLFADRISLFHISWQLALVLTAAWAVVSFAILPLLARSTD
jgi:hypothetical protein